MKAGSKSGNLLAMNAVSGKKADIQAKLADNQERKADIQVIKTDVHN